MKVIIQKPDLDTCLTALIMGVSRNDVVCVENNGASPEDIADSSVICIESGGSGLVSLNNFDHHDPDKYFPPACQQAYEHRNIKDEMLGRLVRYVCIVDDRPNEHPPIQFPSLSSIFSGMLLYEKEPLEQLFSGIDMLKTVLANGIDPFESVPDLEIWHQYKEKKQKNLYELEKILSQAEFFETDNGTKSAYLESSAIGGIGSLYAQNCGVVIIYSPSFGNPPIRKFTIASQNKNVSILLDELKKFEEGWGGRETIIGSPRSGTMLDKTKVLSLVKKLL